MSVSKTTDSGANWTRYNFAVNGFTYALAVDPANSDIVYVGGVPGLYMTTDGGVNWSDVSVGLTGCVYALAIAPQNPRAVFAGTPDGVFKSTDSGRTWSNTGCSDVNALLVHHEHPDTIYAGTSYGVFVSTTGGGGWTAINEGLDTLEITSLGVNSTYLFAGTDGKGIYRRGFEIGKEEAKKELSQNLLFSVVPNPARSEVRIHYVLSQQSYVELTIYEVQGRLVHTLVSQTQDAGAHSVLWDGLDKAGEPVSSGIYFARLSVQRENRFIKLLITK